MPGRAYLVSRSHGAIRVRCFAFNGAARREPRPTLLELQRLAESGKWVVAKNLELETGFASLDLGAAAQRNGLFRAIRR